MFRFILPLILLICLSGISLFIWTMINKVDKRMESNSDTNNEKEKEKSKKGKDVHTFGPKAW
jgi:hypothetical protein